MSFDIQPPPHAAPVAEPDGFADREATINWGEHIVTLVATSIGVLIVAAIAVLMGMA
jgi:hypothetical protein